MNRIIDHGVWIEADAPLADTPQWSIPLRLVKAVAEGEAANLGSISPLLAGNLETIRDIYAAWIDGHKVPLNFEISSNPAATISGVSLFFSGGVDSFYSLIKHRDEIDNLVLVHGFDIPLENSEAFALAETQVREAARLFGKRLIVVRTNLREEQPNIPGRWEMYHGAAMAAVAYALAPNHGKVYIASSNSYVDLHTWGSHPLLDPLWSTEAVQIVHDGGETRMNKLRALVQYPEAVARLRVCWRNPGSFNCGHCEKCVRTMLALRALGVERCAAFPDILTPNLVSQQNLDRYTVRIWRELLGAGLPPNLNAAVRSAMPSSIRGLDDDVVIICQGGGNFGDLYPFFHESRERVIKLYPNNPIVILPQTVYFNSQDRLGQSMKIFREHRNCHIFARDAHSLEILQRAGIHRSSTMPDMAQYLWRSLHPDQLNCYEEQPMRFVRRDKEFKPSAILRGERRREQTYDWPIIVSRKNSRQARMVIAAIQKQCEFGLSYQKYWQWHPMQERAIRDGVRFFSNFRKIYTNRLHAMILGLLLEREVCAFDNSYGKLSSYRNCWLSGMESLTWEPEE